MLLFFDLPEPIRIRIYSHLINSSHPQPATISEFHDSDRYQRLYRHGSMLAEANIERHIRYPSRIHLPFEGWLRVSRQARSDMKIAMRNMTSRKIDCALDIVVECENWLYPTWLVCPSRSPTVRRLDVEIRLLGCAKADEIEVCQHLSGRNRCRTLAFAIVAILARFIERGSRFEHARGELEVHTIVLSATSKPGVEKFLELTPALSIESGDDWDTDTLVDGEGDGIGVGGTTADSADAIDGPELLRMIGLVLKPLCRESKYLLVRRKAHFSAGHLALIRRNVRRIYLELDGRAEGKVYVNNLGE
jgi:hypothetical protein